MNVSIVIITKNEAHILGETLRSVQHLTDDIIIVDSGSTDGTQAIAKSAGATVIDTEWKGFGLNKNVGIQAAKHDWILSIDADEQPDETLIKSISSINFSETTVAYNIRFKTFLGEKHIRYGEWGSDSHVRLFNRKHIKWNDAKVHEQLEIADNITVKKLDGFILHYTMRDVADYATKMTRYALLNAEKYFQQGKRSTLLKQVISPQFSFFKHYILQLGFLDGREGYLVARITTYYTFLKYARLHELNKQAAKSKV